MSLFKATAKTVGVGIVQRNYNKEVKQAQPKAYKQTCKDARGKFDPNWHSNYKRNLSQNLQKAKDKKERRTTFINNL